MSKVVDGTVYRAFYENRLVFMRPFTRLASFGGRAALTSFGAGDVAPHFGQATLDLFKS
jgi:hypothetical protein